MTPGQTKFCWKESRCLLAANIPFPVVALPNRLWYRSAIGGRGGRVAEGTPLLREQTLTGLASSNLALSAMKCGLSAGFAHAPRGDFLGSS
jgi:hypothetical protein